VDISETSINIYQTTKRHVSEDAKLQPHFLPCNYSCQMPQCLGSRLLYKVSEGNKIAWLRRYFPHLSVLVRGIKSTTGKNVGRTRQAEYVQT